MSSLFHASVFPEGPRAAAAGFKSVGRKPPSAPSVWSSESAAWKGIDALVFCLLLVVVIVCCGYLLDQLAAWGSRFDPGAWITAFWRACTA